MSPLRNTIRYNCFCHIQQLKTTPSFPGQTPPTSHVVLKACDRVVAKFLCSYNTTSATAIALSFLLSIIGNSVSQKLYCFDKKSETDKLVQRQAFIYLTITSYSVDNFYCTRYQEPMTKLFAFVICLDSL